MNLKSLTKYEPRRCTEFYYKVKGDPTFAKSISKYPLEERKDSLINAGFNFPDEELRQAREEMSDDELAAVAAGGCNQDTGGDHCGWNCDTEGHGGNDL